MRGLTHEAYLQSAAGWVACLTGMNNNFTVSSQSNPSLHIAVLAVLALLLSGCGAASSAASGVRQAAFGLDPDPGVRRTVVVEPGYWSKGDIRSELQRIVQQSADRGQILTMLFVDGGNASSAQRVDLSEVNGGDLRRHAESPTGRQTEADKNTAAVMSAVDRELQEFAYTGTGVDLFGAIERAIGSPQSSTRPSEVVVLTGGGVHQSATLDLVAGFNDVDRLVDNLPPLDASHVSLLVIGVNDFREAEEDPSTLFTETIQNVWDAGCAKWTLRSCDLASSASAIDELSQAD